MGRFVEVCRKRGLKVNKVNAGESRVMVLNRDERFKCEVCVDGIRLENVLEFKYLECVLDDSCTDEEGFCRKVGNGRRVAVLVRSLTNARGL